MVTTDRSFALAVVLIFVSLSLPIIYVAFRHGFRGLAILGWGYLLIFCTLKVVGSGMQLSDSTSSGAAIITSVGLSPLLLATAGVLHEARFYHPNPEKRHVDSKKETRIIVMFHMVVLLGIALVAIGLSKLTNVTTPDKINQAWTLARVGAAILFVSWLAVTVVAIVSSFKGYLRIKHQSQHNQSPLLLAAVLIALPFVGVRVVATLGYLVTKDESLSAVKGTLSAKVGLYLIEEIISTVVLVGAGIKTRNIRQHPEDLMLLDEGLERR